MQMPEFPQEFVKKHCRKVCEARDWRKHYKLPPDPEEDEAHAECGFVVRGIGLGCENCGMYLHPCKDGMERPHDAFYPQIKKFYDDLEAYEKWERESKHESGAFI